VVSDALIGHTGFVGGNLLSQHRFAACFNSRTIDAAAGQSFGTLVCAAAPGSMVEANTDPERDTARIQALCQQLSRTRAERFVLISSIAVLDDFAGGDDETTGVFQQALAYGRNRRALEVFCADHFSNCLILRLPALFGAGIKKNFLFDLLNPVPNMLTPARMAAALEAVEPTAAATLRDIYTLDTARAMHVLDRTALDATGQRAALEEILSAHGFAAVQFTHPDTTYQYYNLDRIWADIGIAAAAGLEVLHLATEPLKAAEIHQAVTHKAIPETGARHHHEDMRTCHAALWGESGPYLATADRMLAEICSFFAAQKKARAA